MSDSQLKTITIDELLPGMYVHKISAQSGKVKMKSQGRVTRQAVVDTLKRRGVTSVTIDLSKAFEPTSELPEHPRPQTPTPAVPVKPEEKLTFQQEVVRAERLHRKGKEIQKQLLSAVRQGEKFDEKIPREFTRAMIASIDRNPDALVCMTKIREKDDYLLEHSLNVAIILAHFARFLEMPDQAVEELAYSGFLHDIGKIRVPDEILHKPGKLNDMEMNIMRDHVYYGVRFLESMGMASHITQTVGEHHERLDGYGYPNGSRGDEISREGRMLAIVDMYDALTADRCYKAGMPGQKALQILLNDSPEKLDRELVQRFIKCMGVYPVGSLVKLSNERIAMVVRQSDSPLTPLVKVFYSLRGNHFLEPKDINLAQDDSVRIERAIMAGEYRINFNAFFEKSIAI